MCAAVSEGRTNVVVTATDPGGLSAATTFRVVVGNVVSFGATVLSRTSAAAPEGGVARVTVSFREPREADVSFSYAVGMDADPTTADADAEDHGDAAGTVTIPARETSAVIAIPIRDDADIEPAREAFIVTLEAPAGITVVGATRAVVHVEEGVCDRSAAVREALSRGSDCTVPTPARLAAVRSLALAGQGIRSLLADDLSGLSGLRALDLRGNALTALPAGLLSAVPGLRQLSLGGNQLTTLREDALAGLTALRDLDLSHNRLATLAAGQFAGLPALRRLRLDGNALAGLPDRLFAGIADLRSLLLEGNPGAPFALPLALRRTDAEPWAPGPATVRLAVPTGAPFDIEAELSASGAMLRDADGALRATARVATGATEGMMLAAESEGARYARVAVAAPALPETACDGAPCWQGFELAAGQPLVLFSLPPIVGEPPAVEPLYGESLRLPLNALTSTGDAGPLRWTVASSDEAVATVRVVGDELVVEPADAAEGVARIEAIATDAIGQSAIAAFDVTVEFYWPVRPTAGWRGAAAVAD